MSTYPALNVRIISIGGGTGITAIGCLGAVPPVLGQGRNGARSACVLSVSKPTRARMVVCASNFSLPRCGPIYALL